MMILYSFRGLLHFWDFGVPMVFLIPAALVTAFLLQLIVFRKRKRPALPLAVCGGVLLLCEILVDIAIVSLERNSLGIAFLGLAVEMFLLAAILGFAIGLLIHLLTRKKAA